MTQLARPSLRPNRAKPKVLLVRQPVKSVRASDEHIDPFFRIRMGITIVLGILLATWLFGLLGYRLGYAPTMRVPHLSTSIGESFTAAVAAFIDTPRLIVEAGVNQTLWMMLGFVLIAIPAAALSAIRSYPPGGPRPPTEVVVFSYAGAIFAALTGIVLTWWTILPWRRAMLAELPGVPAGAGAWITGLQTVAGLDALGLIAIVLATILTMRLVIPTWLRAICASFCFAALAVVFTAASVSTVTASQIDLPRARCFLDDANDSSWRLVVGQTDHQIATFVAYDTVTYVELRDRPAVLTVTGRQSIAEAMSGETAR